MTRRGFLDMRPAICAHGYGVVIGDLPPVLVCGLAPGHDGPHRDVKWPVAWDDRGVAAR